MSICDIINDMIEDGKEIVQLVKHGDSVLEDAGPLHLSDYIVIYKK
jgi:hypothetical protein